MHILTIDLEEWFHCDLITGTGKWESYERRLEEGTDRILEGLAAKGRTATFFCLGWCVRRFPEVIRKIHAAGHGLGCHSDMHEMVFRMDRASFTEDTRRAIGALTDITGEAVRSYRAPAFSITAEARWAFEVLLDEGIEVDASIFPARRDYGGFPSFGAARPVVLDVGGRRLREFPINLLSPGRLNLVFSGGGYFRLFPYALLRRWTRRADYVMGYFHPRDFDPGQPVLRHLPLHRQFKSYYGLKGAFPKFLRLIEEFDFISLEEAERRVDWERVGVVEV